MTDNVVDLSAHRTAAQRETIIDPVSIASNWKSYAVIPDRVLFSREYVELPQVANLVLSVAASQYKPRSRGVKSGNNGAATLEAGMLASLLRKSERQIKSSILALLDVGLLIRTKNHGAGRPTLYAVTWRHIDDVRDQHGRPLFDVEAARLALESAVKGKEWRPK